MRWGFGIALAAATLAIVAPASAADLRRPVYTKAPAPAPIVDSWAGFYIGAHVGAGNVSDSSTLRAAPPPLLLPLGTTVNAGKTYVLGGGQLGYNWQSGLWVYGIEGDISVVEGSNIAITPSTLIPGAVITATSKVHFLATVTGRLGYVVDGWLLYAKGGVAFMDVTYGGSVAPLGLIVNPLSDTRVGYTVGAGVERKFFGAWSWKAEYNYMRFEDTYGTTTTPAVGISTSRLTTDVHVGKVGVNYRFSGF